MVKCQNTIITPSYKCLTKRGQFDAKRWGQFTTKYKGSICREMRGSDCAEYPSDLRNSKTLLGAPQLYMAWDETVRAAYWPSNAQGYSYWSEFNNKKIKTTDLTQGKVKLVNMLKRFKP